MSILIEDVAGEVRNAGGINTALPVTIASNLTVTGTTTIAGVTLTDLTTTGNTVLGNAVSDTLTITGATTIQTTAAAGFTVGAVAAGATPAFSVDASTSSQVAGLKVTGAVTGGTVAVVATDSGTDTNLTVNAKGAGTIGIGSVSTGAVTITPATTITGLITATGGITSAASATLKSGTAVPATAGAIAAGAPITCFSSGWKLWVTSDVPSHSATKGDLCMNTGGSSSSTRLYVNNGTTSWIAITTAS